MPAIVFDPRTKILLLLLATFYMGLTISVPLEIIVTIIYIFSFFLAKKYTMGIVFLIVYILQLVTAFYILPYITSPFILYTMSFLVNGLRQMMPSMIAGVYALTTTHVSEWIAAFKEWHFPNSVIIPFAVIFRFFPTIREDYRHIRRAMAFRGIGTSGIELLKHPIQSFEYILIPLLMNASQVAEDLTISAMTKGLAMPGKHTSIVHLQMTTYDWLYLAIAASPLIVYLGGMILL